MHVIKVNSANQALVLGLDYLLGNGEHEDSRVGPVLVAPEPVAVVYEEPWKRVLFSAVRDANPAFHLLEAIWCLAGRSDAAFLNNYVKDFGERFAEANGHIHGAYGRRWRESFGYDQLHAIIRKLRKDPNSRQAVLQIWDPDSKDLEGDFKDRPCNLLVMFRIRQGCLDMTVCNRSNDLIWGLAGSNVVQFGLLQEYMAGHLGIPAGTYTQFTNNLHAYLGEIGRLARRADCDVEDLPEALSVAPDYGHAPTPLMNDPPHFDEDLETLVGCLDDLHSQEGTLSEAKWSQVMALRNTFLYTTVWRVAFAHKLWRVGNKKGAPAQANHIEASDWCVACKEWYQRRLGGTQASSTDA